MLHFFVGRAVGYASEKYNSLTIMERVKEKIQESIRAYYYQTDDTTNIEQTIIQAWINLANNISSVVESHLYENGIRNDYVLVLKSFQDELVTIIATPRDDAHERGTYSGR